MKPVAFLWLPGVNKMELCKARISNGFTSRLEACQSLPEIQTVTPVPFVKVESNEVPQISAPQQLPATQPAATIQIHLRNADITIPDGTSPQTIRATLLALKELC